MAAEGTRSSAARKSAEIRDAETEPAYRASRQVCRAPFNHGSTRGGMFGGDLMADLAVGYGKVQEAAAKDPEFAQVQARA